MRLTQPHGHEVYRERYQTNKRQLGKQRGAKSTSPAA